MTIIVRTEEKKEEVIRNVTHCLYTGGQFSLSFKFKDSKRIISVSELVEIIDL